MHKKTGRLVVMQRVSELYKECTLAVINDGKAASDNCRRAATTAVVDDSGTYRPRCPEHRGLVKRTGETGRVSTTMPVLVNRP